MGDAAVDALLDAFPDPSVRGFEEAAVALVMTGGVDRATLRAVLDDAGAPPARRYAAFFSLGTLLRRSKDLSLLLQLIEEFRPEFEDQGTFPHLQAMALQGRGGPEDLAEALRLSERAAAQLPDHPGVLHSLASISLAALEDGVAVDRAATLALAGDAVRRAIAAAPRYAKFHATQARWRLASGDLAGARSAALRAIDLEDSSHVDYHLRLSEYNLLLSRINLEQSQRALATQVAEARAESAAIQAELRGYMAETQTRYLELLGFFAAIIGLVLAGIEISTGMSVGDGARMMLVVAGAIVAAFSTLLVLTGRPWRQAVAVGGVGGALIVLGLVADRIGGG